MVDSKLCCPVSLQLSISLLDTLCACNDPEWFRPTNVLVDRHLFLHLFLILLCSREMFCHKKVVRYPCFVSHALTALLSHSLFFFYNSVWFADIVEVVCTVFCLDIDTSSSTGKFRKAVSKYSSLTCSSENVVARNVAYF